MGGYGFVSNFVEVLYSLFCGFDCRGFHDAGYSWRVHSHDDFVRSVLSVRVSSRVVNVFEEGEMFGPFVRVSGGVD